MLIVCVDLQMTKRRKITAIMDERGVLQWSGPGLNAALAWLIETGQTEVRIETETRDCTISFGPLLDTSPEEE